MTTLYMRRVAHLHCNNTYLQYLDHQEVAKALNASVWTSLLNRKSVRPESSLQLPLHTDENDEHLGEGTEEEAGCECSLPGILESLSVDLE